MAWVYIFSWLHIGHAKAMNFVFGVAARGATGGECILRFDDTNPAAEKQEYIDGILSNVDWLGHTVCEKQGEE